MQATPGFRPGPGSILASTFKFALATRYTGFLRLQSFFPRVRTRCGHGAQVIVERREKQSDGGEKNKDHKYNPKTTTKGFFFAVTIWVGSDRLLQRAIPPRRHFITARALYYNARYRLGAARALCYNARCRLGAAQAFHYNARYRLGTARALYYNVRHRLGAAGALHYNARHRLGAARALLNNARYRLGAASAPLGPSITMRVADTPFAFYKVSIGSE